MCANIQLQRTLITKNMDDIQVQTKNSLNYLIYKHYR